MLPKISTLFLFCFLVFKGQAQTNSEELAKLGLKKVSLSSGIEGSLLQFANVRVMGFSYKTLPRYSYFFNTGVDINFNLTKSIVPYTGFQLKNIGIITQANDSVKYKERVYTIGAPVGIKLYSGDRKMMFRVGGDIALGLNYKYKYFLHDKKISKMNEFFSDKASLLFISALAGVYFHGISLSCNYYFTNFYNTAVGTMDGKIFTASLGIHLDENTFKFVKKSKDKK